MELSDHIKNSQKRRLLFKAYSVNFIVGIGPDIIYVEGYGKTRFVEEDQGTIPVCLRVQSRESYFSIDVSLRTYESGSARGKFIDERSKLSIFIYY